MESTQRCKHWAAHQPPRRTMIQSSGSRWPQPWIAQMECRLLPAFSGCHNCLSVQFRHPCRPARVRSCKVTLFADWCGWSGYV